MKNAITLAVLVGLGIQFVLPNAAFSGEAGKANDATVEAEKNAAKANRGNFFERAKEASTEAKKAEEAQVEAAKEAEKAAEHAKSH